MSAEKAALLAALELERVNGGGWRGPKPASAAAIDRDDDLTTARRRRQLAEAWADHDEEGTA